ncbi:hypothetical protein Aph01nite_00400 [Acrocarpospora phusangensis]|uniref:Uncharacterized protein n=1 Tax=Acrocarpospora phusangensis TaxID=1070424 RepID=A0A919Q7M9_9ACTN|nr:hypothetical protein [Acrocarpospora phusangensis]GIH21730.1 hypothetical protein Aph01nite_00400 [Acrocarpospora phusangensis]
MNLRLWWLSALTAACALLYAWVALNIQGLPRVAGLAGAAAILASLALTVPGGTASARTRTAAMILLPLGALPLAALTWWSVVTPILALLILIIGTATLRRAAR